MGEHAIQRSRAWRDRPGKSSPTLIAERLAAIAEYDVLDGISMAIRADRARRGLSQRDYAELVGLSKSQLARFECDPGSIRLSQVLAVLARTAHGLGVYARQTREDGEGASDPPAEAGGDEPAAARPLSGEDWPMGELLARTSAGARFPAHRQVRRAGYGGPIWFQENYQCWAEPPQGPWWTAERRAPSLDRWPLSPARFPERMPVGVHLGTKECSG